MSMKAGLLVVVDPRERVRVGPQFLASVEFESRSQVFDVVSFLGSGPDRGRSPVEWGDFPYVRPYVRPSVPPSGPFSQTDGRTDGRTDRRTYVRKISPFYRTLSPIGAAALLPQGRSTPIKRSRARVSLTT